jgi:hypothetical protein
MEERGYVGRHCSVCDSRKDCAYKLVSEQGELHFKFHVIDVR